jgi:choline/glycine/proline betaine transport protein
LPRKSDKLQINNVVFFVSAATILGVVCIAAVAPNLLLKAFSALQATITTYCGWLYILAMTFFLGFVFWLLISPYGRVRLGDDDSRPEFSTLTWLAMLFSAGMGIGILFYGIAEPLMHFNAPVPFGDEPGSQEAARSAMGITVFHWGLHPWACYSIVGLAIAYFGFRKGLPISIRSAFYPLLGERIYGWPGHIIDILAIVSTMFGVATSLGLGAMQVNAGLAHVYGIEQNTSVQIIIIASITAVATISVVTGIKAGIRRLSEANMILAASLMLFIVAVGPTLYILKSIGTNLGSYLQILPTHSFWCISADAAKQNWLNSWTIFYWGWWIAWSPFVGMFVARISRGRTIREFVFCVLLVPTFLSLIWFTVFGSSALATQLFGEGNLTEAVNQDVARALFIFLETYPLASITCTVGILCVVLFFVTSSDSASLVIDTIASGGVENPPIKQRVFWAITEGVVATVLLLAGGLKALQTAAITSALPFIFVLLLMVYCLQRALRSDVGAKKHSNPSA